MFEKIWKDPVWSKVISVIIIGIAGLIYAKINSIYENETFKDSILNLLSHKIELKYLLIFIIIFLILQFSFKKIFVANKNIDRNDIKREKLKSVNKIIDKDAGLMIKWNVHFSTSGKPFVSEVKCFCILHGSMPIKFLWNKCPSNNCKNSEQEINEYYIENFAESIVLDEWDKINGTKIQQ